MFRREDGEIPVLSTKTRFTARQREVALLIAAGCSNEEVGARLGISARTAKAHADALRLKLGVEHRRRIPLAYQLASGEAVFGVGGPTIPEPST